MAYPIKHVEHLMDARLTYRRAVDPIGALLHTTDGTNSLDWLLGGSLRAGSAASCDFLIKRDGTIYQLTRLGSGSYHAGRCWWQGAPDNSDAASRALIGIELENHDRVNEICTVAQHEALAVLLLRLAHYFNWSPINVWGHYELARPMGRRSDPQGLDWGLLFWMMRFTTATLDGELR